MAKTIAEQVRRRIRKQGEGSVVLVRDFLDLGSQGTITRTLSRLAREGFLRRLQQGVYDYPRFNELLGKTVPPDPAKVAEALARRTGNEIVPSDAQIANALGLTTQVPAQNVYRVNGGKSRRVKVGNQTIELRPISARYFPKSSSESVIQALRFVGEGNVTEAMVEKLHSELNNRQKAALLQRLGDAPGWMHPLIRQITDREPLNT